MHLRACLKALSLLPLLPAAIGVAWSAEAPVAKAPVDVQHLPLFQELWGQGDILGKARAAAGKPVGPVEVFFKRLRVEPSFRATVKAKAFSQTNGGAVTATLLLVRDDGREMLVHTSEASASNIALVQDLVGGQIYEFPKICAEIGVPTNSNAKESGGALPQFAEMFKFPPATLTWQEPAKDTHFLASTLKQCPPFRGTVVKKATTKLPDGGVALSVAFFRPDALPLTITEVGPASETQRFVDFLKEGETYDFPIILEKVAGVQFPSSVLQRTPIDSKAPGLFHQFFGPPGWSSTTGDMVRARASAGTLPPWPNPNTQTFLPSTPEEKALDHYIGDWGPAVRESASGEYLTRKMGTTFSSRRWVENGQKLRVDSFAWPDPDASGQPSVPSNHVRAGFVVLFHFDAAAGRFHAINLRPDEDKLAPKLLNTGLWDELPKPLLGPRRNH